MFTVLALYPIIERKLTGDTASHHLLQRPRDVPVRTALGVMALTFYLRADALRRQRRHRRQVRHQPQRDDLGRPHRLIVLPPIAYVLTYRICLGLQQHDREVLEHGIETGVIRRLPHGEFIEVHQPLGPVDEHGHGTLAYGGAPVPKKMNQVGGARRAIRASSSPSRSRRRSSSSSRPRVAAWPPVSPPSGELDAARAVPPRAAARPTVAGRRSRATDLAHASHSRAPVDSTGALLHVGRRRRPTRAPLDVGRPPLGPCSTRGHAESDPTSAPLRRAAAPSAPRRPATHTGRVRRRRRTPRSASGAPPRR